MFRILVVGAFLMSAGAVEAKKYPWEKPPGPIAGRWKANCPDSEGMVIQVTVNGAKAEGKVAVVGKAKTYGYKVGDVIFRNLAATYEGKWAGDLNWRSVAMGQRWDPILLVATATELDAVMTTDKCYKKMQRAR